MTSTLPPDPYKALGVSKDADASTIKSTYRKLVLKCHPDKVTDESLKQQKQEEFHKIQQAYELIGDEDKRATYDAECKLESMRREKLSRAGTGPNVEVKTARYDVRTQAPAGASFTATGPHRYSTEDRKSSSRYEERRSYDDRHYESPRKYDTYEAYPKHSSTSRSSRTEREPSRTTRTSSDRTRSDHKKTRDREERRERSSKFVSVESESSADEKARFEATYKKNSAAEEARTAAAEARRKAEDRRSHDDHQQRKMAGQASEAINYIQRTSRTEDSSRPSPSRTSSYRDTPEYYESSRSSRREPRSSDVRRSSARPKERPSSAGRDRDRKGIPEIVEWDDRREERRPMPSFKHASSSPAEIHVPRTMPQRSYTESSREHRRTETSPTPIFRRADTMPTSHSSSSRRKETSSRPSGLRETVTSTSRSPERTFPTVPPPNPSTTTYYYATPGGGVSVRPEDVGKGHRTVLREPERHRARSPSPLSRPPMGANRHVETAAPQYTTVKTVPPPLGRASTFTAAPRSSDDRGRSSGSSRLYGEVFLDASRRENRAPTSYSPERVHYSKKIGPEDIRWAPRAREDREYATKPTFSRTTTSVY